MYLLKITDPDHLVVTTRNREKYSCKYKATLGGTTGGDDKEDENQEVGRGTHCLTMHAYMTAIAMI